MHHPAGNESLVLHTTAATYLWSTTNTYSFVNVPLTIGTGLEYSADTSSALLQGYWLWQAASSTSPVRVEARATLLTALNTELGAGSVTAAQVVVVSDWLEASQKGATLHEAVVKRWAQTSCKDPVVNVATTTTISDVSTLCPAPTPVINAAAVAASNGGGYLKKQWDQPTTYFVNYTSFTAARGAPVLARQFPTSTTTVTNTTQWFTCRAYQKTENVVYHYEPVQAFWVNSQSSSNNVRNFCLLLTRTAALMPLNSQSHLFVALLYFLCLFVCLMPYGTEC
jgi:hypothetical protein